MIKEEYPKVYLYRRIVEAKIFIDNHFEENINLDNISGEAHFSKFHFMRLFKNIYGKTPHQYLIDVRIKKAMDLLATGKPVSEVCHAVGFKSLSSFSGLFKRVACVSPSEYLLQQQKLKAQIYTFPRAFIPACFAEKSGWTEK